MNYLESIKRLLESDPGLVIEDMQQPNIKTVVDNRFLLIKQVVDVVENKDDKFYTELVKLIANFIDQLYDKDVHGFPGVVLDEIGEIANQDYDEISSDDRFKLAEANRELSEKLFDYVCSILECNKNITLDVETLKRLLNRNPKPLTFTIEEDYLYRSFDFERLIKIINENQILERSNISIDEIYQLLLDTYQLNNDDVFRGLVKSEQFHQNHKKIDEILTWCNAKIFVELTNIIRRNFDKNFDRFAIIKQRNKDKFCERLVIELLNWRASKEDCDLIHQILTDPEIEIDYDLHSADYKGQTDLRSIIALSGNRTIIKDLLSHEQGVQNYYSHGEFVIQLYTLYAVTGDYEKALVNFEENYNFEYDLYDEDNTWNKSGYAYGSWEYEDSLARFIRSMCTSFKESGTDYSTIINLISRILKSEKIKYINLEETLTPIREVLSDDDFKLLVDALLEKYNSGILGFLAVSDHEDLFTRYIIRIANEDEVQNELDVLNKKEKNKKLIYAKKDDSKH